MSLPTATTAAPSTTAQSPHAANESAVSKVFNTPELTEGILLLVGQVDVMKARRINKFVNGVIAGSAKLQGKMFLQQQPLKPEDGDGYSINKRNEVLFPIVHWAYNLSDYFCFRFKGDPGHYYGLRFMASGDDDPAGDKLMVERFRDDHRLRTDPKYIPEAFLAEFLCTHECPMAMYVVFHAGCRTRSYIKAPPKTTLRELLVAITQSSQAQRGGRSRRDPQRRDGIDFWY